MYAWNDDAAFRYFGPVKRESSAKDGSFEAFIIAAVLYLGLAVALRALLNAIGRRWLLVR